MSLLNSIGLVTIDLYYKIEEKKGVEKILIVADSKAEELIKNGDTSIEKISTKWKTLNFEEHNIVMEQSFSRANEKTGAREFSWARYRDMIVKTCLKQWDIVENGKEIPVTPENINSLPPHIVFALFRRFDDLTSYTDEEWGN